MEDLRYPIGKYNPQPYSDKQLKEWLIDIEYLPAHLENAVINLDEAQLNTAYRPDGWTVKQVIHHVADSHINSYIRFKFALTEDNFIVKPYDENAWANLEDTKTTPINVSLTLLHSLHTRWLQVLKSIQPHQWEITVTHPEHNKQMSLWFLLGLYAWHGRHHTAHITSLRERNNW